MDPNKPFVVYTKRQDQCQSFAANAKEPITEVTMINTGLAHVIATGLMTTAIVNGSDLMIETKCGSNQRVL